MQEITEDQFDEIDANNDGFLNEEELDAIIEAWETMADTLLDQFDTADTNGDGQLSYDEAHGIIPNLDEEQFNAMDGNGDGYLTIDELEEFLNGGSGGGCGCCKRTDDAKINLKRYIGDWLLVSSSLLVLLSIAEKQKR